jgi:hypothetical protein
LTARVKAPKLMFTTWWIGNAPPITSLTLRTVAAGPPIS